MQKCRNERQSAKKKEELKDVKGNIIHGTGEFSTVSDEEIIGVIYDASTIETTIDDVVEEFTANFNMLLNNLRYILENHKSIVIDNRQVIIEMLKNTNKSFQDFRKEFA